MSLREPGDCKIILEVELELTYFSGIDGLQLVKIKEFDPVTPIVPGFY